MKFPVTFSLLLAIFFTSALRAQDQFCHTFQKVSTVIQENHYAPKAIDDSLSAYVFKSFLDKLDNQELILLQQDFDSLQKHQLQIDNYLQEGNCNFFDDFFKIYKKRLEENKIILSSIAIKDLDYSGKDTLKYYQKGEKRADFQYAKNKEELQTHWSRKIRKETIDRFLNTADSTANFNDKKEAIATQIIANELCNIDDRLQSDAFLVKKMQDWFLNLFCSYFDPHTNYFNNSEKSFFDESLRDDYNSIGVFFNKNDDGTITVSAIEPGSTAWKQDLIHEGDEVLQITAQEQTLDMTCISLESLYSFIYKPEYHQITLQIRSNDRKKTSTVTLQKESIHVTENTVDSYILEGTEKIGYIKLPSFYTSEEFGMGCTNDIAKEILRLNKEGISALVLDLRNNGGGSLEEANDLVGLFIDRGPVAMINNHQNKREIYKDFNRGAAFTKPLAVMVNGNSASASEYVSAALQDHQRAVIIGSPTFGKASGQVILPVDTKLPEAGYVKVTVEKLYRITGKSWQKKGVIPDFPLPNPLKDFEKKEADYPNVLASDTIVKNIYFKLPEAENLATYTAKSEARIATSKQAKTITYIHTSLDAYADNRTPLPLTLNDVKQREAIYYEVLDSLQKLEALHTTFTVDNTRTAKEILATNEDQHQIDTNKKEQLQQDYQLAEAYLILADILTY